MSARNFPLPFSLLLRRAHLYMGEAHISRALSEGHSVEAGFHPEGPAARRGAS